jgi:hypothetical protein
VDSNSLKKRLKVSALLEVNTGYSGQNTAVGTVTLTQGVRNLPFKTDPVNARNQQCP